jgi:SAM-dependent methyltransferase
MTRSQFDDVADDYPEYPHELPLREHMELHSLKAAAGDVTGLAVLDLGCGAGRYAQYLARWGAADVIGVDASAGMLDLARATEEQDPLGITYRHADATTEHLADLADTRDLVLSCYAIPYAATREALTGMFTTARTVLRDGGRFVAATLNPDYADESTLPGHYEQYNMRLAARPYPPSDGDVVHLTAWFGDPSGAAMEVDAYWWSAAAYEEAARAAGFSTLTWKHFSVSDLGVRRYGTDLWQNYLDRPHAMIVEAS